MKVNLGKYPKIGERKVKVEIDRFDIYSMDHTLAYIILPLLLYYREHHNSVPNEFTDYGSNTTEQLSFDFYGDNTPLNDFEAGCERWNEVLDKMIWSFHEILTDNADEKYIHGRVEYDYEKCEGGIKMIDNNPEDHWFDANGHAEHLKRIQEGLDLFSKYYRNLWD